MKLRFTERADKDDAGLPVVIRKVFAKQPRFLLANRAHPSLRGVWMPMWWRGFADRERATRPGLTKCSGSRCWRTSKKALERSGFYAEAACGLRLPPSKPKDMSRISGGAEVTSQASSFMVAFIVPTLM
jgi:hypothetical protein